MDLKVSNNKYVLLLSYGWTQIDNDNPFCFVFATTKMIYNTYQSYTLLVESVSIILTTLGSCMDKVHASKHGKITVEVEHVRGYYKQQYLFKV